MVDPIDPTPISRSDRNQYEQEYKHGVDLFQRAFNEYCKADEVHKKDAFREVMDRALQVLNETARELKRGDLLKQNQQLANDWHTFEESQNNQDKTRLASDLNKAKDSLT